MCGYMYVSIAHACSLREISAELPSESLFIPKARPRAASRRAARNRIGLITLDKLCSLECELLSTFSLPLQRTKKINVPVSIERILILAFLVSNARQFGVHQAAVVESFDTQVEFKHTIIGKSL